jgi:putative ABC transport system permease protein
MARWALRLFRREWRQQLLVLALLTVAVAAGVFGEAAAYNVAPTSAGAFGSATFRIRLDRADIDAARSWFGTIDVIAHSSVPVPGSVEALDLRAQDPHGPYGAPMLGLRAGRYPTAGDEVALTDGAAATLGAGVGTSVVLNGRTRAVVGLVENPADLNDEFVLEPAANGANAPSALVLVRASPAKISGFRTASDATPRAERRGGSDKVAAAVAGFGAATVVLLLISLVAGASFAVIAQRRLRQLGMVAAVGATQKQIRMVLQANGAVIGVVAAVTGAVAGLGAWMLAAPHLETAVAHRIDRLDLPWSVLALGLLLAVVVATGAAWWPGRTMSRVPITAALSSRLPRPRAVHRSALLAGVLLAGGFVSLAVGIDPVRDAAKPPFVVAGIVATAFGLVLISPFAVRALAAAGGRAPIAMRLALRDLGRYQARSASALAAISLTLAIAVSVVLLATAAVHTAGEGNLSDRTLLLRLGPTEPVVAPREPADMARAQSDVDSLAASLGGASVVPLQVAVDPAVQATVKGRTLQPYVTLGHQLSPTTIRFVDPLYVATPELLAHLGLDGRKVDPAADVLTGVASAGLTYVAGPDRHPPTPRIEHVAVTGYSSAPRSLITLDGLRRAGWQAAPAGWFVETAKPLTAAQLRAARDVAAGDGLTVESRNAQRGLTVVRNSATVAGALLALGVLAMTVGLIRGEAAADLRTLTAAGATGRVRRAITATTAGALGLLGVVLGTVTAYVGIAGGYSGRLGALGHLPLANLAATIVGVPTVAALAGWVLGGRLPPAIARPVFE